MTTAAVPAGTEDDDRRLLPTIEIYKNYDQRRESLNDRRATRNTFYMVFLTSLLTAIVIAQAMNRAVAPGYLHLTDLVGAAFCVLWFWNLSLIQQRIQIMHAVLRRLEEGFPVRPYWDELDQIKARHAKGAVAIIRVEKLSPVVLGLAFVADSLVRLFS